MFKLGQANWDDIKILGYVCLSVCLSVCIWENCNIDIKNFTVSQLTHIGCIDGYAMAKLASNWRPRLAYENRNLEIWQAQWGKWQVIQATQKSPKIEGKNCSKLAHFALIIDSELIQQVHKIVV